MTDGSMNDPAPDPGVSRRAVECCVAATLFVLAVLVLWDSLGRGARWGESGPENGYFPARVGTLLLIASVFAFVNGLRQTDTVFVTWTALGRVATVFVPLGLYVAAIGVLGIYVSSGLFMAAFMLLLGSFRWWVVVLASFAVPLIAFWTFEMQFLVSLPKGPVENWLGY